MDVQELKVYDARQSYENNIQPILKKAIVPALLNKVPLFASVATKNTKKKTVYSYDGNLTGNNFIYLFDDRIERHICVARDFDTISPFYALPDTGRKGLKPFNQRAKSWIDLIRLDESDVKEKKKPSNEPTLYDQTELFEQSMEPYLKEWLKACTDAKLPAFYCVAYKNQRYRTYYSHNGNTDIISVPLADDRFPRHFDVARGYETMPPGATEPFKAIVKETLDGWTDNLNGYVEEYNEEE